MTDMQDKKTLEALAGVPLFATCTKKQLKTVAAAGKRLKRREGTVIAKAGASGIALFVILDGCVDVVRDGALIARLYPQDFMGEMALLSDEPRNADLIAVSDVELFTFTQWTFKSLVRTNPDIAYAVMKTIAARQST